MFFATLPKIFSLVSIAHIVNPVKVSPQSDLYVAQPITFESMKVAKNRSKFSNQIQFYAINFPEDDEVVPEFFVKLPHLSRSVLDVKEFEKKRKLPLIADILHAIYKQSDAEYIIYTNVDIALQPQFYDFVFEKIEEGYDAFMINRRRIPYKDYRIEDLPDIYSIRGKSHPGFDCFVFQRNLIPKFVLDKICLGVPFIEAALAHNLFAFSQNFKLFDKEFLTFHIGMEVMKKHIPEYYWHNRNTFFKKIKPKLWHFWHTSNFPHGKTFFLYRYWRWGTTPSLFVYMNFKIEMRDFFKKISERHFGNAKH